MQDRDKILLEHIVKSNGKDIILARLNEEEDRNGVINSEFHVSFSVDCTKDLDMDSLQIELNSNVGDLPFMIDDRYGLDKVLVTIGFNDKREAAEINELVCNLMFGGSIEDYIDQAEYFYLGNVEALGLPISPVNEGAFDSYKNKRTKEEKEESLRKQTEKIIVESVKKDIEEYVKQKLMNDGEELLHSFTERSNKDTSEYMVDSIFPFTVIADSKNYFNSPRKTPESIGKKTIEVFPRIGSKECVVVIFFASILEATSFKSCTFYDDLIFDYITNLEEELSREFEMNVTIKLRLFAQGKEGKMLDKGSTIRLHKFVSINKFIDFMNRFLVINTSSVRRGAYDTVITVDKNIFNKSVDTAKYPWAKSFYLFTNDIRCQEPGCAFSLLQSLANK